jgi:3-dehydroquinate synthase
MMNRAYEFRFGSARSRLHIGMELPTLETLIDQACQGGQGLAAKPFFVCDANTAALAGRIMGKGTAPCCVLAPGEAAKNWASAERILQGAHEAGLGRDGLFIGVGGGVVCDLTAFAASVYMRGAMLCLVPTTLLAMADAALGGKTGFDLFGIKNLAGTFYPAQYISAALNSLATLPEGEWKSGFAELLKTAVLDTGGDMLGDIKAGVNRVPRAPSPAPVFSALFDPETLFPLLAQSMEIKGRIVEADPRETGTDRALLNLGHTFGHALEAAVGLGRISHGEAVAWGMVRACELGCVLGITPRDRAADIAALIRSCGYETAAPHPLMILGGGKEAFMNALGGDKKKKAGKTVFVVPGEKSAILVTMDKKETLPERIIDGEYVFA